MEADGGGFPRWRVGLVSLSNSFRNRSAMAVLPAPPMPTRAQTPRPREVTGRLPMLRSRHQSHLIELRPILPVASAKQSMDEIVGWIGGCHD
jgi:hypothetical protein